MCRGDFDQADAGMTFDAICERLAEGVPESEVALRAVSLLRGWIAEELIVDAGPVELSRCDTTKVTPGHAPENRSAAPMRA
jgi:hypothetical protein